MLYEKLNTGIVSNVRPIFKIRSQVVIVNINARYNQA